MRKFLVLMVVVIALALIVWQKRVDLVVWGAPKLIALLQPVGQNVPVEWAEGPETPVAPPGDRPPNVILILTDDMGFNDISLYNGGAGDGSVMTPNIDALAREGVTFNVGEIAGGGPVNIVPDLGVCRFNVRLANEEDGRWAMREIERLAALTDARDGISARLHGGFTRPPKPMTPQNAQVFEWTRAAGAAIECADADEMTRAVDRLLTDETARRRQAEAARRITELNRDVVETVVARLAPLLARTGAEADQ